MNGGKVRFGGNSLARVAGISTLVLNDGETKVENVLYVKGLKHNLLSVSQLCDQGYDIVFNSDCCVLSKSGKLIANATRSTNNLYILDDTNCEKYCLSQLNETWLWHRRLRQMHFKNLIQISKKDVVRDMPTLEKPTSIVCRDC